MFKNIFIFSLLAATAFTTTASADDRPDFTSKLTGNWGGARDTLYDRGVTFDAYYKLDLWSNFSGGIERDEKWNDNLDLVLGLDGEKIVGVKGLSAEIYAVANNGLRPNDMVGSHGGLDNIETAESQFKLYTAWVQQNLMDDRVSVKVGLYDLNTEFYVTDASGLFINPTYGIGTEMAATGDNGPSVFPNASLAARVSLQATPNLYVQAAILDGVPNDPNNQDSTQIEFDDKQGALWAAEVGYRRDQCGHYGVGVWGYTADRPDQLTGAAEDSQGIYFLAEKSVYQQGDKNVDLFGRIGFTQADVEQFDSAYAAGAVFSGFISARPEGQIGIGVSGASNSSRFKRANPGVDGMETQVELTLCRYAVAMVGGTARFAIHA